MFPPKTLILTYICLGAYRSKKNSVSSWAFFQVEKVTFFASAFDFINVCVLLTQIALIII
jgi:hypothetical protein